MSLRPIQMQLEELTGFSNPFSVDDFIIPTDGQNALIVSETSDSADIAVCLKKDLIELFSDFQHPTDFNVENYRDLSVVIEELSHFNFYVRNALRNLKVSRLDMEVQAEVDKFAFALDGLHRQNQAQFTDQLFGLLFDNLQVGDWVKEEDVELYERAHEIARAFCRKLLATSKDYEEQKLQFKDFFASVT